MSASGHRGNQRQFIRRLEAITGLGVFPVPGEAQVWSLRGQGRAVLEQTNPKTLDRKWLSHWKVEVFLSDELLQMGKQ
jgi:hypothetical protein